MGFGMKTIRKTPPRALAVLLLSAAVPFSMGGCPDFQDTVASAFETATRSVADAAVTLFFDQFRSN
jgi:hypothetical protein